MGLISRVSSRTYRKLTMSSENELQATIIETLKESGAYDKLQAQVYQNLFSVMNENPAPRPTPPVENVVINALIQDYLEFNRYEYSKRVLEAEHGDSETNKLRRVDIAEKLNISGDFQSRPILYAMIEHF